MKIFDWFKCLFTKCDKVENVEHIQDVQIDDVNFVNENDEKLDVEIVENESENKNIKLTTIEKYAHKNDDSLTEFVIEQNVEKIELSAFYGCMNLKTIRVETDFVPELGKTVFQYRKDNKLQILPELKIYVKKNLIDDFKNDKMWSKYVNNIEPIN